jgi:tetratricopeptide (TPR) repeat protein
VLITCVGIGFAARIWTRTPVWRDDRTLLLTQMREQPESYHTHQSVGNYYLLASRWRNADSSFRIARTLFAADPGAYIGGAEAALSLGNCDGAAGLLDSAIRRAPTNAWLYLRLSEVRLCQRRWRAAVASALGGYELAPDSLRAIALVAAAAQQIPDAQIAADAYRRAVADHPGNSLLRARYAELVRVRRDTLAGPRAGAAIGPAPVGHAADR